MASAGDRSYYYPSSGSRHNSATPKKVPPPVAPKPKAEPLKKKSVGRGGGEDKKVPPPVAPKPGQRRLNLNLPGSKSKVK